MRSNLRSFNNFVLQQESKMKSHEEKYRISRKPLKGKQLNGKLSRVRKTHISTNTSFSPSRGLEDRKKQQFEKNIVPKINEQSISFIAKNQEGSFISHGHEGSIDSFDKILFDVEEVLNIEDSSQDGQLNYSFLYREFEKLCKEDYGESRSSQINEVQGSDGEIFQKQRSWEETGKNNILGRILRQKIEEVKQIRKQRSHSNLLSSDPNISIRLLGANLSEIHEEQVPSQSTQRMDPIEQQFIDFVNTGQGASKINISKIQQKWPLKEEKKVSVKGDTLKQTEEDQVVAMLQNELVSRVQAQQESINEEQISLIKMPKKQSFLKQNYKHILQELQENQDKKIDISQLSIMSILTKRTEWIQNRQKKSSKWKKRQLQLIGRFKQILENPYAEHSDEDDFDLQI